MSILNISRYLTALLCPIHIINIYFSATNIISCVYSLTMIFILFMLCFSPKLIYTKLLIMLQGCVIITFNIIEITTPKHDFNVTIIFDYLVFLIFCTTLLLHNKFNREVREELLPPLKFVVDKNGIYECQICLEESNTAINLPCKHKFHKECLLEWFEKKKTCPSCRYNFENVSIIIL